MAYFLLKTEPSTYSWADLEKQKRATWDGVANPVAIQHMRAAKTGDRVVIYHTGDERRAVGLAEIVSEARPDPTEARQVVFDLVPVKHLVLPVELAALKAAPAFADSPLVKMGRLSVVPLTDTQWRKLLALSNTHW